ncbi:MAG: TrkH family potassium uptake protein [Rhodobacteraceae bacterium]|nr:TrkH family potassium uptake protein [Paracoccaceae bacterium]
MFDLRPIFSVIGLLVAALGATMLVPMGVDLAIGSPDWAVFLQSAVITMLVGISMALASTNGVGQGLSIQQTFILTTAVWLVLPIFGALPFFLGEVDARLVDAVFEAMSGLTTTGATVLTGLDDLPEGLLLWRSMLQWFGGVGIIVVAMVFLPELRIGGMQIFRTEGFDTMGKVLPRAAEIAGRIISIYLGLTLLCGAAYLAVGMAPFDAINHALTTLATGGFSTRDASFGAFSGAAEYVAALFMILASLPFVRYVQMVAGTAQPLFHDRQIRGFLTMITLVVSLMVLYRIFLRGDGFEPALREGLFNITSIISGTGYASTDYQLWGTFPVMVFFLMGLVGGCAGSTSCSIKIFRYQLLFASIQAQIRAIHSPHGVFPPRYDGRTVAEGVLSSVMTFFVMFVVSLGVLSVALSLTGLDPVTAVSGAASALANIGPGLGDIIGPAGNFASLNDSAKWLLTAAMLVGRLELLVVYVLFTATFWRG